MGENARGLFGFLSPWVSRQVNRCCYGIEETIPSNYGSVHSRTDIYGDVILVVQKAAAPGEPLWRHRSNRGEEPCPRLTSERPLVAKRTDPLKRLLVKMTPMNGASSGCSRSC